MRQHKTLRAPKKDYKLKTRIGVFDYETDPFLYGRDPEPFVCGFYDGETYVRFWGEDCVDQFCEYLSTLPPGMLLYAHNGGKFDFFFMLDYIENPIRMINGRIVECVCCGHILRDSYSIIAQPLSAYAKDEIDYSKMEPDVREEHKEEISKYLESDCFYLYDLVAAFCEKFTGKNQKLPPLTIGSTALRELRKFHPQKLDSSEQHDVDFRAYYFGGRVQCFESGIVKGKLKVYDVNSMYPYVMAYENHPFGTKYVKPAKIEIMPDGCLKGYSKDCVFFIRFSGKSKGHIPYRNDMGGIDFLESEGVFNLVSHEFKAAYSKGFIQIDEVYDVLVCLQTQKFTAFVETYNAEKVAAKKSGDKVAETLAKLTLNSAYGKFSQDPRRFRDWYIEVLGRDDPPGKDYKCKFVEANYRLWEKPVDELKFNDVAIAASITSAARAVLLDGIYRAKRVVYCDTDSLICEDAGNLSIDSAQLGKWKYEGEGETMAIAGKKLYCLVSERLPTGLKSAPELVGANFVVKKAAKGAKLSGEQIFSIAEGQTIEWFNPAPAYSLKHETKFVHRKIRAT